MTESSARVEPTHGPRRESPPSRDVSALVGASPDEHDSLIAEYALRDLVILSSFVDYFGRTFIPDAQVKMLRTCGMPNEIPVELVWTTMRGSQR